MGCDIHWILERRHQDGAWEAVQSDCRYWLARRFDPTPAGTDPRALLDERSYATFARLSGVRGRPQPDGAVAADGLPDDLSAWARTVAQGGGWRNNHSPGHLGPDALPRLDHPDTRRFAEGLRGLLASPFAAVPLAPLADPDGLGQFADVLGLESAHARLAREARGAGLLPPDAPDSWRLLLSYDN